MSRAVLVGYACAAKTAVASRALIQLRDLNRDSFFDSLNDELRNSIAALYLKWFALFGVDHNNRCGSQNPRPAKL